MAQTHAPVQFRLRSDHGRYGSVFGGRSFYFAVVVVIKIIERYLLCILSFHGELLPGLIFKGGVFVCVWLWCI